MYLVLEAKAIPYANYNLYDVSSQIGKTATNRM